MLRFLAIYLLLIPSLCLAGDGINIVTYNIRNDNAGDRGVKNWPDRKDTLTAYVLAHNTSIIGFQEVKHNQLQDLIKSLPDYAHTGVGRDDGKTAGEYSPIFFDRRTWKIDPDQHGTYWLSATPDKIASRTWGNSHNRICSWARFIRISGPDQGGAIYVYNTHWDHRSQPSRVESGKLMLQRIKTRKHQDEPYILMGDLNATTDNPAVKQLLDSGLLIDHGKVQKRTSSGWKSALTPGLRIDHVFTSPDIAEATAVVDSNGDGKGNAASDHHPVRLTVPDRFLKPASSLDGATGNIYQIDLNKRCFELLKETEYDPQSDVGQSRFTVHWDENTTITKVGERTHFGGIKGPVVTEFYGIDEKNSQAMKNGQAFEARVAVVHVGRKDAPGPDDGHRKIIDWFTPGTGDAPRGGTITINDKPAPVTLRKRFSRLYVHEPLQPADLDPGFWKTTIEGREIDGRFVISHMQVSPLADPRTTDDPKLPRVLVVGDSISMNYHEAAKDALKGIANYHRNEGNCFSTVHGVNNMELWLGNYHETGLHWDVIQFNHGLHDLKQAYDKDTDTFGAYAVPLDEYKANLEKEIAIMKKTGATLIWCATTPVPNSNKGKYARRQGAAAEFNTAAMEVMRKHPDIIVNDLHKVISESTVFDNWRQQNDVHFYKEDERRVLGDAVAKAVKLALKQRSDQ